MAQLRALRSRRLQRLLNPQNPSQYSKNPLRIHSNTTQCKPKHESSNSDPTHDPDSKPKKPLHVLFKEAVGLSEVTDCGNVDNEVEASELSRKLRKLEEEVRKLKEKSCEGETPKKLVKKSSDDESGLKDLRANNKSLYTVFASNGGGEKNEDMANVGMEDPRVYKELSREMGEFVTHLFEKGYLRGANFLPRDKFDINCFENSYARDFFKYVSVKFGKDNQEIAK